MKRMKNMSEKTQWDTITIEEKNMELYRKQVDIHDKFLARNAISKEEHDRSLKELNRKMIANHV